ncbi:MAG: type I-E CRISPR-associated protein Cas6/Cse3/CasE [Actinomycetota bacterium]|jgi:CRISPR system Cascade subunit CasE|nr:type I-E CRISPR-associated protein Cas6/Cse3/CasE [Actinomycetota bacterium]
MHLTRFNIDLRRRGAQRYLRSPQRLHAAICKAATPQRSEGEGRVLWRLDGISGPTVDRPPILWIASPEPPGLDDLAAEAGLAVGGTVYTTKPYVPLLDRLTAGQRFGFRLAANAVRSRKSDEDANRSKRFGHVTVAQQLGWLVDRADRHGFAITPTATGEPDAAVVGRRVLRFNRDGRRVTVAVAEFGGRLDVTDAAALRRTLTYGIGHARAYGCGLLTLAPAR